MGQQKISVSAIEKVQRAAREAPKYRTEEVTKLQAVRMLVPAIHEMKAKGYSLEHIAGVLSDNGVPVTASALKSYLTQVRAEAGKKTHRVREPPASAEPGGVSVLPKTEPGALQPRSEEQISVTSDRARI